MKAHAEFRTWAAKYLGVDEFAADVEQEDLLVAVCEKLQRALDANPDQQDEMLRDVLQDIEKHMKGKP